MDLFTGILITSIVSVLPDIIDKIIATKHRGFGHSLFLWIPIIILTGIISFITDNLVILIALLTAVISHIIFDVVTRNGYPIFYPKKIMFVALNQKKRFKTGTKQDKAVFVFLILLLIPALVFSFNLVSLTASQAVQVQDQANNSSNGQIITRDNINLNIDGNMNNKNITIKKVTDSETQILIQDL